MSDAAAVTIYDMRETFSLAALGTIERRHGATWQTRRNTLAGFEMTEEMADEFITSYRPEDVLFVIVCKYGVTVYLASGR